MKCRVSLCVVLALATSASANLSGIPLEQHAVYQPPGPPSNPNQGGTWSYVLNHYNLGLPTWAPNGQTLTVPNSRDLTKKKDLWLEVDYSAGNRPAVAPAITVTPSQGVATPSAPVAGANDWTYHWLIIPQPSYEELILPPTFFLLQGNIIKFEVGTNCTLLPEPAALATAALWACLVRRKRNAAT